ncbi:hypothetical protein [Pseudonocardia sp. GCM10023141]|uniref:hypothetical protein n=1 Tax=Pseudonocardia sp. GCM10023141 TaxID=3252653 RepID=UPI00361A6D36
MDERTAAESTHDLLLALAGRVDDDMLGWARELAAVGEDARAVELLTASLLAEGTGLPEPVHAALVAAGRAARVDPDAATLPIGGLDEFTVHRFDHEAGAGPDVAAAVRALPARQLRDCRVLLTWRLTPAGSAPGPLPHPVLLVEVDAGGPPTDVLAYQLAVALERAGAQASVEVLTAGRPLSAYHAAALRNAVPARPDEPAADVAAHHALELPTPLDAAHVEARAGSDHDGPDHDDDRFDAPLPSPLFPPGSDPLADPMPVSPLPAARTDADAAGLGDDGHPSESYAAEEYAPEEYPEAEYEPDEQHRPKPTAPPRPTPVSTGPMQTARNPLFQDRPEDSIDRPQYERSQDETPQYETSLDDRDGTPDAAVPLDQDGQEQVHLRPEPPSVDAALPAADEPLHSPLTAPLQTPAPSAEQEPLPPPVPIRAVPDPGGRRRRSVPADDVAPDPIPRPAPRPVPGRGPQRRQIVTPISRNSAPSPIPLVRRDGTPPSPRALQPVSGDPEPSAGRGPDEARPGAAFAALDDPLAGPLNEPLLEARLEPTILESDPLGLGDIRPVDPPAPVDRDEATSSPVVEPTDERWAKEWASGSWAMAPSALVDSTPATRTDEAPTQPEQGGRRRARHRSGDEDLVAAAAPVAEPEERAVEAAEGHAEADREADEPAAAVESVSPPSDQQVSSPQPAPHQPPAQRSPSPVPSPPRGIPQETPELQLRPESLARLSEADRELLARLQAELGQGRKPRVTRRAGVAGVPTNGSATNGSPGNGSGPTNGHGGGGPDMSG